MYVVTDLEQAIAHMVQQAVDSLTAPDKLYHAEELAKRYHCSADTIRGWIRAGLFGDTVNTGERGHLVTEAGIRQFDADHTGPAYQGAAPPPVRRRRKKAPANPGKI